MEKPLSMRKDEFVKNLVKLVNESNLPAFIFADILRGLSAEADKLAEQQLAKDMQVYYESCAAEKQAVENAIKKEAVDDA